LSIHRSLIQAADVAHMSQHWNIYRKWNERVSYFAGDYLYGSVKRDLLAHNRTFLMGQQLFRELYKAWIEGRGASNPADNWYKGELGFFDFYIIPLSRKTS
jgi:hypothetical protein